jgi:hypothetical protein
MELAIRIMAILSMGLLIVLLWPKIKAFELGIRMKVARICTRDSQEDRNMGLALARTYYLLTYVIYIFLLTIFVVLVKNLAGLNF